MLKKNFLISLIAAFIHHSSLTPDYSQCFLFLLHTCCPRVSLEFVAAAAAAVVSAVVFFPPACPYCLVSSADPRCPPAPDHRHHLPKETRRCRTVTFVCHFRRLCCAERRLSRFFYYFVSTLFHAGSESQCELQQSRAVGGIDKMPEPTHRRGMWLQQNPLRETSLQRHIPPNPFVNFFFCFCHRMKVAF